MSQSRNESDLSLDELCLQELGITPGDLKEPEKKLNESAQAKLKPQTNDVSDLFTGNFLLTGYGNHRLGQLRFLMDNMQTLKEAGFDTIFLDSLNYPYQTLMNEYFESGTFSEPLKMGLTSMDEQYGKSIEEDKRFLNQEYNLINLFEKARAAKIRIVGLSIGLELSLPAINLVALKIIEKEQRGSAKKWCAVAHLLCTLEQEILIKHGVLEAQGKKVLNLADVTRARSMLVGPLDQSSTHEIETKQKSTQPPAIAPEIEIQGVTLVRDQEALIEEYKRAGRIKLGAAPTVFEIGPTIVMRISAKGSAVVAVPQLKQSISKETKDISDVIAVSSDLLPHSIFSIDKQDAIEKPAEYVPTIIDSPESVAAYCLKLFKSSTQNGVSCALNQLPQQHRTGLLNAWLDKYLNDANLTIRDKYLLLIFYYSDPAEWQGIKEINPSRIQEAIKNAEGKNAEAKNAEAKNAEDKNVQVLPPGFLHAVKVKLNFYERKFFNDEENLKQTQQLLAQSTLHLNFRGIRYDWISVHHQFIMFRKIKVDLRFKEGYDFSTLDFTNARLDFEGYFVDGKELVGPRNYSNRNYNFCEADCTNAYIKGAHHCDFSGCLFRNTFIQSNLSGSLVDNATFIKCKIEFNLGNVPDFRTAHYDSNLMSDLRCAILANLSRVGVNNVMGVHEYSLLYLVCKKIQKNFVGYNVDKDLFKEHMKDMTDQDILLLAYGTGIEDEELSKRINDIKVDQYLQLSKLVQESIKIIMTPEKLKELSDALPKPAPKKKLDPLGSLGDQLITLFDSKQPTKKESKADHLNPKPSGKK